MGKHHHPLALIMQMNDLFSKSGKVTQTYLYGNFPFTENPAMAGSHQSCMFLINQVMDGNGT